MHTSPLVLSLELSICFLVILTRHDVDPETVYWFTWFLTYYASHK